MRKYNGLLDNPSSAFSFVSVINANTNMFPGSGVCDPNDVSMLSAVEISAVNVPLSSDT